MHVSIRGWSRDHGAMEIQEASVRDLPILTRAPDRYQPNKKYLIAQSGDGDEITGFQITQRREIRASGDYMVTVNVSAHDIMYMAWAIMRTKSFDWFIQRIRTMAAPPLSKAA